MTDELIKRLREFAGSRFIAADVRDAAALIEQQAAALEAANARIAELEAAAKATVPDGWKLVPVEPTTEMVSAARIAMSDYEADEYELKAAAALRSGIFVAPTAAHEPVSAASFALRALVAAGHVSQTKVDEAIAIARMTPGVDTAAIAQPLEAQADARDAWRYRWLRDWQADASDFCCASLEIFLPVPARDTATAPRKHSECFDAAIDAAMSQKSGEQE